MPRDERMMFLCLIYDLRNCWGMIGNVGIEGKVKQRALKILDDFERKVLCLRNDLSSLQKKIDNVQNLFSEKDFAKLGRDLLQLNKFSNRVLLSYGSEKPGDGSCPWDNPTCCS